MEINEALFILQRENEWYYQYNGPTAMINNASLHKAIGTVLNYYKTNGVNIVHNSNDVITVAEKLYHEANPNTKMDVPSYAYERVEAANKRRIKSNSKLDLYTWCKHEFTTQ